MVYASSGPALALSHNRCANSRWEGCRAGTEEPLGLPAGFPQTLDSDMAWTGATYQDNSQYIYQLTTEDKMEITKALAKFKSLELDGDQVDVHNFILPNLGSKLTTISEDLHDGKGFSVIRGITPADYSVEDLMIIWLGIQAYIADKKGRQDHMGNMLVHIVADNSSKLTDSHHRHSTSSICFHQEEATDIAAWLTRSTAAMGGRCIISSFYHVYNVLAAHRPDIIRTLAKSDWPFAIPRFQCRPVIFSHNSRVLMNLTGRTPLIGSAIHERPKHLPTINAQQEEALSVIEAIAQATQLEIQTQAGDMHFINNLTVMHRREGFVNGTTSNDRRHLVRMRLRSSRLGWSIPEELQRDWTDAYERKGAARTWHLEPMPSDAYPLRKYTN